MHCNKIKDGNNEIEESRPGFTIVVYISPLYFILVRYHKISINKYVYHLIDIHIPHSLKRVLLLKLTAAICSLNCIQINVKYEIIIFKIIFLIRLEKGVYVSAVVHIDTREFTR